MVLRWIRRGRCKEPSAKGRRGIAVVTLRSEKIGGYSNLVVGGLMGIGFLGLAFWLAGPVMGGILSALLAYEGWTLVNRYPEDTLSESVWRLSARPMVPFVFGIADGAWIYHIFFLKSLIDPKQALLACAIQFLMGHFFFQAQREEKKIVASDVAAEVGNEPAVRKAMGLEGTK